MKKNNDFFNLKHLFLKPGPILALIAFLIPLCSYAASGHDDYTQYNKGERLFYGLKSLPKDAKSCISCHNIKPSDTLNWNPTAFELSYTIQNKSFEAFKSDILQPVANTLKRSHIGYKYSEKELKHIKLFIDYLPKHQVMSKKPSINRAIIFAGAVLLILLLFVDLGFTKFIKFKIIHVVLMLFISGYVGKILSETAIDIGRSKSYAPDQPIKFSHKIHVGENKIECKYCHTTADYSKSAGLPPTELCLNCHTLIREGTNSGKFEINKIHASKNNNTPIEWIKIHNLEDHVFFSHAQHVAVGEIDCQVCHGEIEKMDIVQQVSDLSMGWCVNCHRETKVEFTDNKYYETFEELHEKLKNKEIDSVTASMVGATDCSKCHY